MNYTYLVLSFIFSFLVNATLANNNPNAINIQYEIYDNITVWGCDFFNGERGLRINILSVTGGSGNYNIVINGNGKATPSNISSGEGFVYFFTKSDVQFGNVGFTVTDTQGNSEVMQPNLVLSFSNILNFALAVCNAPDKCAESIITHTQNNSGNITSDVYQASNKIMSTADMPDGNVSYLANNEIFLDVGFHVKLISNFTADIVKPCSITIE